MASGRSMLLTIRLLLKGENLEQDSRKAQSAVKDLDKAVQDSNKSQIAGSRDASAATNDNAQRVKDLAKVYTDAGYTSQEAFLKVAADLRGTGKVAMATADDVKKLGDVSLTAGSKSAGGMDLFSGKLKDIGKGLAAGAIVAGITAISAAVVDLVKGANKAYQDLQQSTRAVGFTFGETAEAMIALSETAAERVGLAKSQYLALAEGFGTALKAAGQPAGELVAQSDQLIQVATDLATVWGGTTTEAAKALQDALGGNKTALSDYRIDLSDAALAQFAAAEGLQGLSDGQLIYAKILSDTAQFQGEYNSKTNEGTAKQQELNAKWEDAKARLGEALQPALIAVMEALVDHVIPAVESTIEKFDGFISTIGRIIDAIKPVLDWLSKLQDKIGSVLDKIPGGGGIFGKLLPFSVESQSSANIRALLGDAPRADGGPHPVSSLSVLNPTFNLAVSIDGEQLQYRIGQTVRSALDYDGGRLAAGGWY